MGDREPGGEWRESGEWVLCAENYLRKVEREKKREGNQVLTLGQLAQLHWPDGHVQFPDPVHPQSLILDMRWELGAVYRGRSGVMLCQSEKRGLNSGRKTLGRFLSLKGGYMWQASLFCFVGLD